MFRERLETLTNLTKKVIKMTYLTKTVNSKTNLEYANLKSFRFLCKKHKAIKKINLIKKESKTTFTFYGKLRTGESFAMPINESTGEPTAFFVNNKKVK